MSLQTRLTALVTAIGADVKQLRTDVTDVQTRRVVYVETEAEADALPANTLAIILNPVV